jgi:hypothetical protein
LDLARALDRLEPEGGPWERHRLAHGSIRDHLALELPSQLEVDELALLLAGLEEQITAPLLTVAAFDRGWLIIHVRAGTDPVSRTVEDIDAVLTEASFPVGLATMPLRELERPGTIVATLAGVTHRADQPG